MESEFEIIKSLEEELVGENLRKDPLRLANLLCDDFEEIGLTGKKYNKSEIINTLPKQEFSKTKLQDFKFQAVSKNEVKVTYTSTNNLGTAFRTSIWQKNKTKWQIRYHVGSNKKTNT